MARLTRSLSDTEYSEITIPDEQALGQRSKNDPAGQDLLTHLERADRALQGGSAQGTEANDHAHQTPIRAPVLVAIWGELLGHASIGPHAHGAAVQQGQHHALPLCGGTQADDFAAL